MFDLFCVQEPSLVEDMAGALFESIGRFAGEFGLGWRCMHCNKLSNEYTGNIIDGTARCPNCGLNPSPFGGNNLEFLSV